MHTLLKSQFLYLSTLYHIHNPRLLTNIDLIFFRELTI